MILPGVTAAIVILSDYWTSLRHFRTVPGDIEREAIHDASCNEAVACVDYASAAAEMGNAEGGEALRCPTGSGTFLAASSYAGSVLLMDTGACDHLVGLQEVKHLKEYIRKSTNPIKLDVATGQLDVTDCIDLWINELELELTAYILKDNPGALSVGRLCIDNGYDQNDSDISSSNNNNDNTSNNSNANRKNDN